MTWFRQTTIGVMLTCADWRLHHGRVDLYKRMCRMMRVNGLDVVAIPGPDGLLAPERAHEWDSAITFMKVMIRAHKPTALSVVAHQTCLRHAVDDDQHEHDVLETAMQLKERTEFAGPVLAVVATHGSDRNWGLKEVGVY